MNKAESLRQTCLGVNDLPTVVAYPRRLATASEAVELAAEYDLIVDCTDNPASRYMLNDAALATGKPLLAASAVGMSGQVAVYNLPSGPCLRCTFPQEAAGPMANCEDDGVLGPVCGIIGTLAALEAVKLLAGGPLAKSCLRERLLLFDALDAIQPCRTLRIRKRPDCPGCSQGQGQKGSELAANTGAAAICSGPPMNGRAPNGLSLGPAVLRERLRKGKPTLVLDVRGRRHFEVAHLEGAVHWPLDQIYNQSEPLLQRSVVSKLAAAGVFDGEGGSSPVVICACRRGNDSCAAMQRLREAGIEAWNLDGGLEGFSASTEVPFKGPALT